MKCQTLLCVCVCVFVCAGVGVGGGGGGGGRVFDSADDNLLVFLNYHSLNILLFLIKQYVLFS